MRKNHSYSLPKIGHNISPNRNISRIQPNSYNRLNFPQVGDSGYYGNTGRKHYVKNNDFIHRLILNPDYGKSLQEIPRSKSQVYLKINPESVQKQSKTKQIPIQQMPLMDSLTKLQQQFNKKLTTQASPQKNPHSQQINTEIIKRKSSNLDPYNNNASHYKLFGSVDNYYQAIHNPGNSLQLNLINRRKFNPTFLSSELGYV